MVRVRTGCVYLIDPHPQPLPTGGRGADRVRRGRFGSNPTTVVYCSQRRTRNKMPSNMLNGGQVIVDYLVREKVPYVFGLCGHGNVGFIDALYERACDIKTISVHHESVAGFMADVYYRVDGRPAATFNSCGP